MLFIEITKFPIAVSASLATLTGFILARGETTMAAFLPFTGILLLAAGSAALNNIQDRRIDARMERTRRRALPSGRIAPGAARPLAFTLAAGGVIALAFVGPGPMILGLVAMSVYNGLYAFLKRRVWWAVFPGALAGMIPPAVGWLSAGGDPGDPRFLPLAFFFYLWQVPHAWGLAIRYGREHREAGLPSVVQTLDPPQLVRITSVWSAAAGVSLFCFPLFGAVGSGPGPTLVLVVAAGLSLLTGQALINRAHRIPPGNQYPASMAGLQLMAVSLLLCAAGLFGVP